MSRKILGCPICAQSRKRKSAVNIGMLDFVKAVRNTCASARQRHVSYTNRTLEFRKTLASQFSDVIRVLPCCERHR